MSYLLYSLLIPIVLIVYLLCWLFIRPALIYFYYKKIYGHKAIVKYSPLLSSVKYLRESESLYGDAFRIFMDEIK